MKNWSAKQLYELTGNAPMPYNTLYQIYEDVQERQCILENADSMLFLPDLLGYWLTGEKTAEQTIASTSQMIDMHTGKWAQKLLEDIKFPLSILPEIKKCGTQKGLLKENIANLVGLKPFPVIAGGSHDTASAVVASPLQDENSIYLSCGSWSLLGIERKKPIITNEALENGFTHEVGFSDSIRFLKGINGLRIIQLLQRKWQANFGVMMEEAEQAVDSPFVVDVNDDRFYNPQDIEAEIQNFCMEHKQGTPKTHGEITASVYKGLVHIYKNSIEELQKIAQFKASSIHVVGGGSKDELLNRLIAKNMGIPVFTGPVEASALGNTLIQLYSLGFLASATQMRDLVRTSFDIKKID
ncbi:MAG: rhamnulokinase [Treponemataceae bacterium]